MIIHPHKRLRADLILLFVAIIWGSAFSAQRVAASYIPFFIYNGLRFAVGAITVYGMVKLQGHRVRKNLTRIEVLGGLLCGGLIFGGSNFQQAGLQFTSAGKAGFITGLYVVLVPCIYALFKKNGGRESLHWSAWAAAFLATCGLFFLSATETFSLTLGDTIVLGGTLFWALHIIAIGYLAPKVDVLRLAFMQFSACALLNLGVSPFFESISMQNMQESWWTVMYVGVFSVGVAYTLQVVGQQEAPETDAAIIMSMEAVFAALFGWLWLNECLTWVQLFGCGLIIAGMLLAQMGGQGQYGKEKHPLSA